MPTSAVHEQLLTARLQSPVEGPRDADVEVTLFRALRAVQVEAEGARKYAVEDMN